jgi:hypothetical protein
MPELETPLKQELFLRVFDQSWENARHLKTERVSSASIFALLIAGSFSLLNAARSDPAFEIALLVFLTSLSLLECVMSVELVLELKECIGNVGQMLNEYKLGSTMGVDRQRQRLANYLRMRWLYPIFYGLTSIGLLGFLVYRLMGHLGA